MKQHLVLLFHNIWWRCRIVVVSYRTKLSSLVFCSLCSNMKIENWNFICPIILYFNFSSLLQHKHFSLHTFKSAKNQLEKHEMKIERKTKEMWIAISFRYDVHIFLSTICFLQLHGSAQMNDELFPLFDAVLLSAPCRRAYFRSVFSYHIK